MARSDQSRPAAMEPHTHRASQETRRLHHPTTTTTADRSSAPHHHPLTTGHLSGTSPPRPWSTPSHPPASDPRHRAKVHSYNSFKQIIEGKTFHPDDFSSSRSTPKAEGRPGKNETETESKAEQYTSPEPRLKVEYRHKARDVRTNRAYIGSDYELKHAHRVKLKRESESNHLNVPPRISQTPRTSYDQYSNSHNPYGASHNQYSASHNDYYDSHNLPSASYLQPIASHSNSDHGKLRINEPRTNNPSISAYKGQQAPRGLEVHSRHSYDLSTDLDFIEKQLKQSKQQWAVGITPQNSQQDDSDINDNPQEYNGADVAQGQHEVGDDRLKEKLDGFDRRADHSKRGRAWYEDEQTEDDCMNDELSQNQVKNRDRNNTDVTQHTHGKIGLRGSGIYNHDYLHPRPISKSGKSDFIHPRLTCNPAEDGCDIQGKMRDNKSENVRNANLDFHQGKSDSSTRVYDRNNARVGTKYQTTLGKDDQLFPGQKYPEGLTQSMKDIPDVHVQGQGHGEQTKHVNQRLTNIPQSKDLHQGEVRDGGGNIRDEGDVSNRVKTRKELRGHQGVPQNPADVKVTPRRSQFLTVPGPQMTRTPPDGTESHHHITHLAEQYHSMLSPGNIPDQPVSRVRPTVNEKRAKIRRQVGVHVKEDVPMMRDSKPRPRSAFILRPNNAELKHRRGLVNSAFLEEISDFDLSEAKVSEQKAVIPENGVKLDARHGGTASDRPSVHKARNSSTTSYKNFLKKTVSEARKERDDLVQMRRDYKRNKQKAEPKPEQKEPRNPKIFTRQSHNQYDSPETDSDDPISIDSGKSSPRKRKNSTKTSRHPLKTKSSDSISLRVQKDEAEPEIGLKKYVKSDDIEKVVGPAIMVHRSPSSGIEDKQNDKSPVIINVGEFTWDRIKRQISKKNTYEVQKEANESLKSSQKLPVVVGKPKTHFTLALFTLCFCLSPFGLLAMLFAMCSASAYKDRDVELGKKLSKIACILSIIGILATMATAAILIGTNTIPVLGRYQQYQRPN